MTIKFFPLFFKEDLQLSPVAVQTVFVLMPAANAAFSSVGLRMSKRFGRVQTMLALKAGCAPRVRLAYIATTIAAG